MRKVFLFAVLLSCSAMLAQPADVSHGETFQAYGTQGNPPGWVDIAVGSSQPLARGLYKTWPDPADANNIVYGTKQASGNDLRGGTFSLLSEPKFSGRFEFRGRLFRTDERARLGLTFFSSYPERDAYYLIALSGGGGKRRVVKSQSASSMTMQLTAYGGAAPGGTLDSGVSIDPGRWYEFAIEADSFANATHIRARFWRRGEAEPAEWQIEARDTSVWRLDDGRIGIWSATAGESYVDDLSAQSWTAADRADIQFFDANTQQQLDPAKIALFKRPVRIEVRGATTVKLDGADYTGAAIATDGLHQLFAQSGFVEATLKLLVDQTPPVITLLGNNAPLIDGHVFGADVIVDAKVTDVSTVAVTSTLGALPRPLAQEAPHSITVTAVDQVGWESKATVSFIIDKTPPVLTVLGNGVPFLSGHTFNQDVVLTWSANDATLDSISATLNGSAIQSGAVVTAAQAHAVVVTASDRAGHSTRVARDFTLRKGAPDVRLFANGAPLTEKTYGSAVTITAEILDPTATTTDALLDNQRYTLGTPIAAEGSHAFKITVSNAAGLETTIGPVAFSVDLTPPIVTLSESNAPFIDGTKFNRDVLPVLTAKDNLTASPTLMLLLNGREYVLGAAIAEERAEHVLSGSATDEAGHVTTVGPFRFMLDKTRPVVTVVEESTGAAFPADALYARPVKVKVLVEDLTATSISANLGGVPVDLGVPITANGTHQLSVTATDAVGWQSASVSATFTIDTVAPAIRFTSPQKDAAVATPAVDVTGFADDATSITVNGRAAQIDVVNKTFAVQSVPLSEGSNELVAIAVDRAGNTGNATHAVHLDTRAPDLAITSPAPNACLDATSVEVRGTVADRAVASVKVNGISATVANGVFTATIPLANEGVNTIVVEASDAAGHLARATVPITVDRTAPVIEVMESAQPFTAALLKRAIALFARVTDAGAPTVTTTLNGQPYASGSAIVDDRVHELKVVATDCAGHTTTKTVSFEIDRTAPSILTINPASGSEHGAKPQITGTTSPDATSIVVHPGGAKNAVSNGAFSIADAPLVHGTNELRFTLTDRAGNTSEETYRLTLDLITPAVEIVESGAPIPANALFNRAVTPVIRSTEPDVTITATLNGNSFVSGTLVSASGSYTLTATAVDTRGHTSAPATATFTIDRDRPTIDITSPADGAFVDSEQVEVRGTITGADVRSVTVNGVVASVAGSAFSALVPIDFGPNLLLATAIDRAGNAASDELLVTRGSGAIGIILTAPADGTLTNRRTTVVAGQILTAAPNAKVTLNGVEIAVDPSGFFRKTDFALTEGENVITAIVTRGDEQNQASVRVTSDLTPPRLRLLESGQPLAEGARFADRAVISAEASDGAVTITPQLMIDSDTVAPATIVDEAGGHTIVATARDSAGNETRVERTIFIGAAGTAVCGLEDFDPVHNALVTSATVTISGKSGGAIGVKVNGTPALVSNGSFCATIELPSEGENAVTIVCTDAGGNASGDPSTLVLRRITADPSIAIDSPAEGAISVSDTIVVSGTASGASVVEVNGSPVTFAGDRWSAPAIRLSAGLNVITARALNAAGRSVSASRRVLYLKDAPGLTITSPATSIIVGSNRIDISGGWSNVDPDTIAIGGATVTSKRLSDTTGTWLASNVALLPGENTITVNGRDAAGRLASASTVVTLSAGYPSVSITEPADNDVFGFESAPTFTVRGSFSAATGSTIEVGGEAATIDAATSTFTATVTHAAGRITPVLVRVTEPEGNTAFDSIRVTRLDARPRVLEHFPIADAVNVDAAAMPLVLFSAPMDLASITSAFRLENASGAPVSGTLRLDRDVISFAPAALLTPGERYTIRVAASAKSIAGDAMEDALAASFTVASSAGTNAPTLAPIASTCAQELSIAGTAPSNARLRIDLGALTFTTNATATGAWSFALPVGGYAGYQVVRVRIVGSDGSLSPATESCFLLDCAGPQVVSATYDRTANRLTITFSEAIRPSSATSDSIVLRLADNRIAGATIAVNETIVTVTPAEDLTQKTFTLDVTTAVEDTSGTPLPFPYAQTFPFDADAPPVAGDGSGFMSGEVFDAETGRPLAGASVFVDVAPAPLITDTRGRYAAQLPEGAHTIRVSSAGYTTSWRQIIISPGAGVIPIDIRLTPTGTAEYTPVDAQSLPGLLPLGWSPLAAGVVHTSGVPLVLPVPAAQITAASQVLTAVRYHDDRDEWRVLIAAANIIDGKVTIPIDEPGAYALVYPDKAPDLVRPPTPTAGAVLTGVIDVCATRTCDELEAQSFTLDPPLVLPTGKTLATLRIKGAAPANFPSGTAVQAYVDEELRLADGSRVTDPPFTTDLLLYRNLDGTLGVAEFKLGPSPRAAEVILDVGFNHIRILPYPGRLDRGTLIGTEGGRVPGDGRVTIEIPAGGAAEAMRATSATIEEFAPFGSIAGFTIVSGFTLTLELAREVAQPEGLSTGPAELLLGARATFPNAGAGQYVLAEVLDGPRFRLAAQMETIAGSRVTTRTIDRAVLPIDGVIREGRYLLLRADSPIAFATGIVRDAGGLYLRDAGVSAPPLGVTDVTRVTGTYALPVPVAPFTLVPSTARTGDGAPYTHPTAPAVDEVVRVDLTLQSVAPRLVSTEPVADAREVSLTAFVKAHFDIDLDAASVNATSIVVVDADTQAAVEADVLLESPRTILWRLRGGENRLAPNRTYSVAIAPTIRSVSGASLGRSHSFRFATLTQVTSGEIHAEKIRITIPDANGHSRVTGTPGALPAGYIALVTRRSRDFATPFQAVAAADGSFTIQITESVALTDLIDLQVLNNARAIAAIIPLTPFVTNDGTAFIARADRTTRFISPDGITVKVPEGAFDVPTLVTVGKAEKTPFTTVPNFDQELTFAGGVTLQFDGIAKKRLEIEIPIPASTDTNKTYYLGYLGESIRGPRVMIVDLLRIAGGTFTTVDEPSGGLRAPVTNAVLTGREARAFLLGATRSGAYSALAFNEPIAWAFIEGMAALTDLFFDTMQSIFSASYYLAERGKVLVPVVANKPFTIVGVDVASGTTVFTKTYDALAPGDPGAATAIASPIDNVLGPYPVFTTPARVEIFDLARDEVLDESVRNFVLTFADGTAMLTNGAQAVPEHTKVELLNLGTGVRVSSDDFAAAAAGLFVGASKGDRLLLFVEEQNVDPASAITVVFNKPIHVPEDETALRQLFTLSILDADGNALPITGEATIESQSGGRRFVIGLPSLQRGRRYRLTLSKDIRDDIPGTTALKLAQRDQQPPLTDGIHFDFATRAPHGEVGEFDLSAGSVRDLALSGNILFVSALDAGLLAYDVSNPGGLENAQPFAHAVPPIGYTMPDGTVVPGQNWAVATDHHGRVYTTAVSTIFGVLRSYRVEDFIAQNGGGEVAHKSSATVSWRPGVTVGLPLSSSTIISDRPEAIPRKLRILTQDSEPADFPNLDALITAFAAGDVTALGNGFQKVEITIPYPDQFEYLTQRVTVTNVTTQFRWSVDVPRGGAGKVTVIGRAGDRFQVVRNFTTHGVINLFGYGLGIYDLNAIESNSITEGQPGFDPGYEKPTERVLITKGEVNPPCDPAPVPQAACNAAASAAAGVHCAPADLSLSPESELGNGKGTELLAWALDANRGVIELRVTPQYEDWDGTLRPSMCDRKNYIVLAERIVTEAGFQWFAHPRLNVLRRLYRERAGRDPVARFTSIASFKRGDVRYGLVAGFQYGVPVVRLDPEVPLGDASLVDVIWIPAGAQSVRLLEGDRLATVVDGKGRVLLIDLTNLDESKEVDPLELCTSINCESELFPTARKALDPDVADAGPGEVGADDPRIVWKSEEDAVKGTLPPLIDAETGFVYTGNVNDTKLRVLSAVDPRLRLISEPRDVQPLELQSIVPLGIKRPRTDTTPKGSLASFRIEVALPGSISETVTAPLNFAVESERVWGAVIADPPTDHLAIHVRNVTLTRMVPASSDLDVRILRYQRGWNRFISAPIVALADPRAAKEYEWFPGANKADEGCHDCERPDALENDSSVKEILTVGRLLSIRPEGNLFAGTDYAFLSQQGRLTTRVETVPADTIRSNSVLVSAQDPPVADGAIQETVYVHSGEVATRAIDLDAEGRAGVSVVIDRTYGSRTVGLTPFGYGWTSSLFEHLRPMPGGEIEYHDGTGEIWTFQPNVEDRTRYSSPLGLFLKLSRHDAGWMLSDQQFNFAYFDAFGRLSARADRFADPKEVAAGAKKGNVVYYLYDVSGRLLHVVDPVGRRTTLSYNEHDLVSEIEDWRGRKVTYAYDAGRLVSVKAPEVQSAEGFRGRAETRYGYEAAGDGLTAYTDFAANLKTIKDPGVAAARVTFEYDLSTNAAKRDRATSQTWATGEMAQFVVNEAADQLPSQMTITDALGQKRIYELSGPVPRHVAKTTLENVPVFEADESLAQAPLNAEAEPQTLVAEVLERNPHGQVLRMKSPHDLETAMTPERARGGAVGTRVKEIVQKLGLVTLATVLQFDALEGAANNPLSVGRAVNGATAEMRDSPIATRNRLEVSVTDDDVKTVQKYDVHGQLLRAAQQDAGGSAETGVQEYQYYDATAAPIARGRIKSMSRPDGAVSLQFAYATTAQGGDRTTITDAIRGTVTILDRDPRGLPTRRAIAKNGVVLSEETFAYDANGLLKVSTRKQENLGDVVTRMTYDDMLRETEVSTTQARVGGSAATMTAKTVWNLPDRTITRTDPFAGNESTAAKEITTLDSLGRTAEVKRVSAAGDAQTLRVFRYDRQGQLSYETDRTRWGVVRVYDPFGRQTLSVDSRMQRHEAKWTAWDHPEIEQRLDGGLVQQGGTPSVVGNVKRIFTRNGKLRAVNEELIADTQFRSTRYGWSNGGRETSVRMGAIASLDAPLRADTVVRLTESHVDAAGRTTDVKIGEGRGISGPFTEFGLYGHTETASDEYTGMLPSAEHVREPRTGASFIIIHAYDGLGRPATTVAPGGYEIQRTFDEAGNVLSTETSGRNGLSQARYDSRGLVIEQIHPDSSSIEYQYDAVGNLTRYRDEQQKETIYETDGLGRVVKAKYPDGTCEATIFENGSGLTAATRDRAGQWLIYRYAGYLVDEIRLGPTGDATECTSAIAAAPSSDEVFLKYGYDLANRLVSIRSANAGVEWADYDRGGRPHTTRSIRYKNGTGLTTGEILDVHSQRHVWSIFDGERTRYRMPVPGTAIAENAAASDWRSWIEEQRDAVGNVVSQKAATTESDAAAGPFISQAFARGIGRLASRERPLAGSTSLKALYGYAEATVVPPAPDLPAVPNAPAPHSGLMGRAEFSVGGATLAGAVVTRDAARRVSDSQLLGLGSRFSRFDYDDRDRLTESILASLPAAATPPKIADTLNAADFRSHRNVTRLSADERSRLGAATAREIELPSFVATPTDAHQIENLDPDGPDDFNVVFSGGRRTSDGLWDAKYDALGRLVQLTRIAPEPDEPARFEYDYNPLNRLVGRRVCTNTDANPCTLETRTTVLARDGLPAHTTFAWDPVTDRLLSIFEAEKSTTAGGDEYAGLQRQYLHGDRAYDDPIVVISREDTGIKTYIPVIDEAATGNLMAVLDDAGTLVERVFYGDSYGASPRYLHGPVVQRMTRKVTKNQQGEITEVVFTANLSDAIRADTVAPGTVLRSVTATSTAAISTVEPTLDAADPHTLRWTLNAAQWNALTTATGATAIEIAITKDLRAVGWGEAEVVRPPDWLRTLTGLRSSVTEPVVHREAIGEFETATEQEATVWAISDLYLVAAVESKAKLMTGCKAAPFVEPVTGLVLFRERWYDAATGSFLTPDPMSYEDSSNLYIGLAGDPVNNSDPTGECIFGWGGTCAEWADAGKKKLHEVRSFVDRYTGSTIVDTAVNAQVGFTLDVVDTFLLDPLRVGDATGVAIGSGASAIETTLSVVQDVGRAAAVAGGAGAVIKAGTRGVSVVSRGFQITRAAYRSSVLSSEVGSVGTGVRNMSKDSIEMAARIRANIEASKSARRVSNFAIQAAKDAQIRGGYAVDEWMMVTLRKGSTVFGGDPVSSFFTDFSTVARSGLSQSSLWGSLQVAAHPTKGLRSGLNMYRVLEEFRVPAARVVANPHANPYAAFGGGGQFYRRAGTTRSILKKITTFRLE